MRMDDFINAMKRYVAVMVASMPQPRRGLLESFNPSKMQVKVVVQPEGALSGWLPVISPFAGSNCGILAVPPIGSQVMVVPTDGFADAGTAIGSQWSSQTLPPPGYTAGEIWLISTGGAIAQLKTDGTVTLQDPSGAKITLTNNSKIISVDGELQCSGEVYSNYGSANQNGLSSHYHSQPNDSHGDTEADTSPPIPGT